MPYQTKTLAESPVLLDEVLTNIDGEPERDLARQIIDRFAPRELPIKVQLHNYAAPSVRYRVLLYAQKNVEAVIINTKGGYGKNSEAGLRLQIRLTNPKTFETLDMLTENIRGQILAAQECAGHTGKCTGTDLSFTYNGEKYLKCKHIARNFQLQNIGRADIASVMALVDAELSMRAGNSQSPLAHIEINRTI